MQLIDEQSAKTILESIKNKDIILIGEIHGIKENPLFVKQLAKIIESEYQISFFGYEYPKQFISSMNRLPLSKKELLSDPYIELLKKDGRFSDVHLDIITSLVKEGGRIVCFDPSLGDWDARDQGMADIFENAYRDFHKEGEKVLVIAGNLHTQDHPIELKTAEKATKIYHPFATHIQYPKLIIDLVYDSGSYFNHSRKEIHHKEVSTSVQLEREGSSKFKFHIDKATPTA